MKNTVTLIKSKGVGIGAIAILAGLVLALGELTSLFTHLPTYEGGFSKVAGEMILPFSCLASLYIVYKYFRLARVIKINLITEQVTINNKSLIGFLEISIKTFENTHRCALIIKNTEEEILKSGALYYCASKDCLINYSGEYLHITVENQ